MISCTEFIPAYNALFKEIHRRGGKEAVVRFWEYLAAHCLDNLRERVKRNGLYGCWEYWEKALNEEAADFTMELDEASGVFQIFMHRCPSKGRLLSIPHITPYAHYCEHCDVLYRRVLEPLGFEYHFDRSRCDQAGCSILIRKRSEKEGKTNA